MRNIILLIVLLASVCRLSSQTTFKRITDPNNPIVKSPAQTFYAGCSWIDYDNDGKLDLFVIRNGLYHNEGNGIFTLNSTSGIPLNGGVGTTWADYNNDGYIDCFISAGFQFGSQLFKNNGNGTFTRIVSSALADATKLRGMGSAFGDFNNDGNVDIFIAAPFSATFLGVLDSSKLLMNMGNGNFSRIDNSGSTPVTDAFTIPTWSDYDDDGDVDLFIGTGRVNGALAPDFIFENISAKNGLPAFSRILTDPLGTDGHDGQIWNWVDFDNDGDLDVYITNYAGTNLNDGHPNDLYINEKGSFRKLTAMEAGPIVSDTAYSLASVWGDFDNDGDLDCFVTNEGGTLNSYYQSNISDGSMKFTKVNMPGGLTDLPGRSFSASGGDYDNDGDLDLYLSSNNLNSKGLYRNELTGKNSWVNFNLSGTVSNKSAIGAKVKIRAHINNGKPVWQMREISAQNSFNGMNMLNAHFGLRGAKKIDDLIIEWPSGKVTHCKNLPVNQFYNIPEDYTCPCKDDCDDEDDKNMFTLRNSPNPFVDNTTISYTLINDAKSVSLRVYDMMGRVLIKRDATNKIKGSYSELIDLSAETAKANGGVVICSLTVDGKTVTKKMIAVKQ